MVIITALAFFLFFIALMIALTEIESEGKYGWAEEMPTWYRKTGFLARIYVRVMSGKPMTGYHIYLNAFILGMFHLPFFTGVEWTLSAELWQLSLWLAWIPIWDFLWFVMNPHYGVDRFKKEHVWWHASSWWVADKFPFDYAAGWISAFVLTGLACLWEGDWIKVIHLGLVMMIFLLLLVITISLAKLYHRHYWNMRRFDDRRHPRS